MKFEDMLKMILDGEKTICDNLGRDFDELIKIHSGLAPDSFMVGHVQGMKDAMNMFAGIMSKMVLGEEE